MQESTLAHLAVQEERDSVEHKLAKVTKEYEQLDSKFDQVLKRWELIESLKDIHVYFNSEYMDAPNSDEFKVKNAIYEQHIKNRTASEIQSFTVMPSGPNIMLEAFEK